MAFRRPNNNSPASALAIIEPSLDVERDITLLGDVLSARGDVTAEAIDAAMLENNGRRIGEHLIAKRLASEDAVAWAVSQQQGLPFVDLTHHVPAADAPSLITPAIAHDLQVCGR